MKYITLSKNKIAMVDDEDYEKVSKWKWYAHESSNGGKFYAARKHWTPSDTIRTIRSNGRVVKGSYSMMRMHRFIIDAPEGMEVDHIDGNGLNNQKENLRIVDHLENMWNQRTRKTSKSGIRGISFDKQTNKWRATATKNGKYYNLGRFKDINDAVKARQEFDLSHK